MPGAAASFCVSAPSSARRQFLQHQFDLFEIREFVDPLSAAFDLTQRLRTPEQQHAQNGRFSPSQIQLLGVSLSVFRNAAVADNFRRHPFGAKAVERVADIAFTEVRYGPSVRFSDCMPRSGCSA
jgi:hypothetical protein